MIAAMNLIIFLIAGTGFYVAYRRKSWKIAVATILAIFLYNHFQPSYMPKGEVKPTVFVAPVASDKPMVDRMSKPLSEAERDAKRKAEYEATDSRVKEMLNK
jgi:hypothetical protein